MTTINMYTTVSYDSLYRLLSTNVSIGSFYNKELQKFLELNCGIRVVNINKPYVFVRILDEKKFSYSRMKYEF